MRWVDPDAGFAADARPRRRSVSWSFDPVAAAAGLDVRRSEFDARGMTLAKAQETVKELSAQDRAELLDWLWEGLQPEAGLQVQGRWALESEDRIDAVDRGELPTVDGRSAMEGLRRSLGA